jgi:hypothetical protein
MMVGRELEDLEDPLYVKSGPVTMQYFAKFSRHQEVRRGVLGFEGSRVSGFWSRLFASRHVADCSWALIRMLSRGSGGQL